MKLIKRLSAKTYKGQDGKNHHYVNYFLEFENGKRVIVKAVNVDDYKMFDAVAIFERTNTQSTNSNNG